MYLEFAKAWRTGMFAPHALLFSLGVIVIYPGFIACYYTPHKQIPVQTAWTSDFHLNLCNNSPSFSGQEFGGPIVYRYLSSAIGLFTQVRLNSTSANAHTVGYHDRCMLTRPLCNTVFSTAWQFSSRTASDGRPDRGSSWKLLLPRRNSAAQRVTMAYDGASFPCTTIIRLCICRGWRFSGSVKNSITALSKSVICTTSYF